MRDKAALAELETLTTRLRTDTDRLARQLAELEGVTYKRGVPVAAPAGQHEARRPRTRRWPGGHAHQDRRRSSFLPADGAG